MRCLRCGKENQEGARFCKHCGNNLLTGSGRRPGSRGDRTIDMSDPYDDLTLNKSGSYENMTYDRSDSYEGSDFSRRRPGDMPPPPPESYRADGRAEYLSDMPYTEEKSRPPKLLYALIGVISILILAVSGLFIWSNLHSGNDGADGQEAATASDLSEDGSSNETRAVPVETEPYSVIGREYYENANPDDPGMAYTNNSSPRFDLHKKKGDFEKVSFDGNRYTFAYPKFLFNRSIVQKDESGESYYLYYEDEKGNKQIPSLYVSCYDDPGDIMERTNNLFQQYADWCDTSIETPFISKALFVNDENITIADSRYRGRSAQTRNSNLWIILSNDGKRSHIWILEYPITQEWEEDYNPINYVIENTYRYCSFGGTEYQPRSFEEYEKNISKKKNKKK